MWNHLYKWRKSNLVSLWLVLTVFELNFLLVAIFITLSSDLSVNILSHSYQQNIVPKRMFNFTANTVN